jgi:hypothetical protein
MAVLSHKEMPDTLLLPAKLEECGLLWFDRGMNNPNGDER